MIKPVTHPSTIAMPACKIEESGPIVVMIPNVPKLAIAYVFTDIIPAYSPATKSPITKALKALISFITIPNIAGSLVPPIALVIAAARVCESFFLKYKANVTKPRMLLYKTFEKKRIGSQPLAASINIADRFAPPSPAIVIKGIIAHIMP